MFVCRREISWQNFTNLTRDSSLPFRKLMIAIFYEDAKKYPEGTIVRRKKILS
jgi:hypothetical protein